MTRIYIAYSTSGDCQKTLAHMAASPGPMELNLLVSFAFLGKFRRSAATPPLAGTILDSGAFSAWKSGAVIDIDALVAETKDPRWKESVALDVIGDAEGSMRNSLYMKARGSPAYPVFHVGDPWEHLLEYRRQFPKVGLSCRFGEPERQSLAWLDRCFALAWPYRFHSFGWVKEDMLMRYPFHTADTASWNNAPCAFARWKAFGPMSVRGVTNLRAEVEWYQKLQLRLEARWKSTLVAIA